MQLAVIRQGIRPGQQLVKTALAQVGHSFEKITEVLERNQPVFLGRLDDAVDGGAGLGAARSIREQPVFPAMFLST